MKYSSKSNSVFDDRICSPSTCAAREQIEHLMARPRERVCRHLAGIRSVRRTRASSSANANGLTT